MLIPYNELSIYEVEQFADTILEELSSHEESGEFVLDLSHIKKIDLCGIQFLLSVNKQCQKSNIKFSCKNIESESVKEVFDLYNLKSLIGIEL